MRIKIPYLQTSPMQDLMMTLALTPLWWILGLYFIIYHFTAFLGMGKLLIGSSKSGAALRMPARSRWLVVFLGVYLLSLLLNAFENSPQRTFASLNNYFIYLSGLFFIMMIYNDAKRDDIIGLMRIGRRLAILGGIIVIASLFFWLWGFHKVSFETPVSRIMPFLNSYPYFNVLLNVTLTDSDWFFNRSMPRIPVFTSVMTASGGQVLALLPMFIAASVIQRKGTVRSLLYLLFPISIALLSLARTPVLALLIIFGIMLVGAVRGKRRVLFILFICLIAVPAVMIFWSFLTETVDAVLSSRLASTRTRVELYQDAIQYTLEHNPVYGIGIKVREGFTTRALGSHSSLIAFFITTGILGMLAYVFFQVDTLRLWWSQRRSFTGDDRTVWTCSGAAFIGFSLWMLTDTLDAVPYISTLYFIVIGILLSWEKIIETDSVGEDGMQRERNERHVR